MLFDTSLLPYTNYVVVIRQCTIPILAPKLFYVFEEWQVRVILNDERLQGNCIPQLFCLSSIFALYFRSNSWKILITGMCTKYAVYCLWWSFQWIIVFNIITLRMNCQPHLVATRQCEKSISLNRTTVNIASRIRDRELQDIRRIIIRFRGSLDWWTKSIQRVIARAVLLVKPSRGIRGRDSNVSSTVSWSILVSSRELIIYWVIHHNVWAMSPDIWVQLLSSVSIGPMVQWE